MLKEEYYAIGLMSGTSLDGLDIAYVKFSREDGVWDFTLLKGKAVYYTAELKKTLKDSVHMSALQITELDTSYGKFLAKEVAKFISQEEITKIDVISSHGHTVFHQPQDGYTLQIGDASWINKATGVPVVCDFRSQDVTLGGQGAPLVPIGDRLLFSKYKYRINLGGFANISYEVEGGTTKAFDICAVNTVLNYYSNMFGFEYDDKGSISRSGKLIPELLEELNEISFYTNKAPKSLGVEWNDENLFPIINKFEGEKIEDIMHTYTKHVVDQIKNVLVDFGNILISGGGAFNDYLIESIKDSVLNSVIVEDSDTTDFKEAIIFSFLGLLRSQDEVNCLAEVTGAEFDHSSGIIFDFYKK